MYSVFIKKNKGDVFPFGANNIIEKYIATYGQNDVLFAFPGYQSTTKQTIDDFCKELRRIIPNNKIFFARGMNGDRLEPSTGLTIHNCHVPTIEPGIFGTADHSKCIVFTDFNHGRARIKAILIGSSNLSYNTYLKSPSPKGEFDVLLIDEQVAINKISFRSFSELLKVNSDNKNRYLFSKTIDEEMEDQSVLADYASELGLEI